MNKGTTSYQTEDGSYAAVSVGHEGLIEVEVGADKVPGELPDLLLGDLLHVRVHPRGHLDVLQDLVPHQLEEVLNL